MNQKRSHDESQSSIQCENKDQLNDVVESKRLRHDECSSRKSDIGFSNDEPQILRNKRTKENSSSSESDDDKENYLTNKPKISKVKKQRIGYNPINYEDEYTCEPKPSYQNSTKLKDISNSIETESNNSYLGSLTNRSQLYIAELDRMKGEDPIINESLLKNEKVDLKNSTNEIGGSSNDSFYGPKKSYEDKTNENEDSSSSESENDYYLSYLQYFSNSSKDETDFNAPRTSKSADITNNGPKIENPKKIPFGAKNSLDIFRSQRIEDISKTSTVVTKQSIKLFKIRLQSYITELDKMKGDLENISLTDQAYESSSELRRRAQLKTEETIADLKILNGYNIDDDESILSTELQKQIEDIYKNSDSLIEKTEIYEKSLISDSESAETKKMLKNLIAELDAKKEIAEKWFKAFDSNEIKYKETLKLAREELNGFKLKEITEKISMLPFNAKKLDFVENTEVAGGKNGQKLGKMQLHENISFERLKIFKFKEIEKKGKVFTGPSKIFEVLDNGMYVVGGYVTQTRKSHLLIYDPIKKVKIKEISFEKRIDLLFSSNNKIALSQREDNYSIFTTVKILDENLNLIKEKNKVIKKIKGVDNSYLYLTERFISDNGNVNSNLWLFDWNLNETKTDVVFQLDNPDQPFYLDHSKINQIEKQDNNYVVSIETDYAYVITIFSETGAVLKKFQTHDQPLLFDSKNNMILANLHSDSLSYFDLNEREMFKSVSLKRPRNDTLKLKHIKIDSSDRLYFTQ